jgi:hypothetical protein
MEGLRKRVFVLAVFFAVAGGVFLSLPSRAASFVTEQWMKEHVPAKIGKLTFRPSADDPLISYPMDQSTYDMLKPFGIVARTYQDTGRQFDVVLVAGNDKENFHDPRVCFSAQGWTFDQSKEVEIKTKTRGTIPASLAVMENQGRRTISVYFYRGPKGFYPSTPNLGMAMLMGPLMGDFKTDAVFYRFMSMHQVNDQSAAEKEIIQFAADWMDAAGPISNGYF